jgi:hypothetical protein
MGWGSGSEVMHRIIPKLEEVVPHDEQRKEVYKVIIDAMEHGDWDTQQDCEGCDDSFDEALKELHPDWFGEERDDGSGID